MKISLKRNDANFCRLKGWPPGTVLVIAGRQTQHEIKITGIGDRAILVRRLYRKRPEGMDVGAAEEKWVQRLVNCEIVSWTLPESKEERKTPCLP